MGTRGRLSAALGAMIIGWATVGASAAVAAEPGTKAPEQSVPAGTNPTTQAPGHRSAGSDDLIYDFVGPNATEKPGLQSR